jgi:hypothetical protein
MFPLKLSVETICSDIAQVTAERCTGVPQGGPRDTPGQGGPRVPQGGPRTETQSRVP